MVWEGASLWMLASEHHAADVRSHAHHAIQITFGLEGGFELCADGTCLTGPVVAIDSDTRHTFQGRGAVAFLFVAPESAAGIALAATFFRQGPLASLTSQPVRDTRVALQHCFHSEASDEALRDLGRKIIAELAIGAGASRPDPRVLGMIGYAAKNLEDRITLPAAADHIHLSPSRARHLFAAHTGLSFKAYVLWLRLERAVQLYADGASLTEAAHQAGFADSAHLSRTFRRTFGLPAAALRLAGN
ncbi:MAG: AraC family transcriptional regulator [Sphingomonas bacterium]|uniref:helix-turn-helix transcriptional regulator n=1 Tax=Sphingomonas bacterium TaxID=1895847 RepID=UPI002630FF48|nr:helix-turn-helix transcriptional regulator [Sphingomonas bacterium]MDB5708290.1 AraC family transcriptional regulator [Sphingomonas bacterium]